MTENSNRAFARGEALMLTAALTVATAVLIAMGVKTNAGAGLNRDLGNLRLIGEWTASYAADFEGHVWGLTEKQSQWPILNPIPVTGNTIPNAARHAIDIIRRRTGRENFPLPGNWIPHVLYNHLALVDYVDLKLPNRQLVATGDVHRMNWTDDPVRKHDRGFWQPYQQPQGGGVPSHTDTRWPYSSSYLLTIAWFDRGQSDLNPSTPRMSQSGQYNSFNLPSGISIGPARVSDTVHPSGKVLVHDGGDWYSARQPRHFAIPDAGAAVLLVDGSAGLRRTLDANPGWRASFITSQNPTTYAYNPRTWEPPTSTGAPAEPIQAGSYRWTRGGLLGRDFSGEEIDSGQR